MKEERILHIVSFNVPFPADYGGVIDVYYKLKSLHEAGIRIILHNFQYGREKAKKLEEYCEEVHYYPREKSVSYLLSRRPFIVSTRNSKDLFDKLCKDNYPILFEGIHCCYHLQNLSHGNRKLFVRAHNIEHRYYAQLARHERNPAKRIYFRSESLKLHRFEKSIFPAQNILAISPGDEKYFMNEYSNSILLPAFNPYANVSIKEGFGSHILYHGNLSVPENIEAASFLLKNIFPEIQYPCIIAGKNPVKEIYRLAKGLSNVIVIANPDQTVMDELISNAQVSLLPAFQESGLKLKLLAALFIGRHCLVNSAMVDGTGLESTCIKAEKTEEFIENTRRLILQPFNFEDIQLRKKILADNYINSLNAERLIRLIWPASKA